MKNEKVQSGGRPSFGVDPARLRMMRKAARLTQLGLAERVYGRLGKPTASANVMKRSYQRWEQSGAMTPETAQHLADELRTTVAMLQGAAPDAPANMVDQVEDRLREFAVGNALSLESALKGFVNEENPIRALAMSVASRVEAAQLSQDQAELSKLAALTGWTMEDLQRPIGVHGHWLLIRTGRLGPYKTELLHGVSELLWEVRQDLEQSLGIHESDARVSFHDEGPWIRIEVQHPQIKEWTRTLRFVRAQPTETGLRWTQPTWLDRFWIDQLPQDAFELANFVQGFSEAYGTPTDLTRLRLAIVRNPSLKEVEEHGPELRPEIVALAKLRPEDPPAQVRASFERDGCAHDLITNWLSAELWEHLVLLLKDWPCEYWRLSPASGRIQVSLEAPLWVMLERNPAPRWDPIYSIVLVEQPSAGEPRSAPWRQASVAAVHERLQSFLNSAREEVGSVPLRALTR